MRNSIWTLTMTGLVLAGTLVACGDDSSKASDDGSAPSQPTSLAPTTETTSSAGYKLLRNAGRGVLDAGSYGLIPAGSSVENVAVIDAPAGYQPFEGWTLGTPEGDGPFRALGIMTVDRVFGDPCGSVMHPKTVSLNNPGASVKDLARALTRQTGVTTSKPVPVTLDGYSGLYLDYHIDDDVDLSKCEAEAFDILTWEPEAEGGWWLQASDERAGIWILDVDGDRVLLSWVAVPGSSEAQIQELKDMAESTTFEPLTS
jgi:hypothetical protein